MVNPSRSPVLSIVPEPSPLKTSIHERYSVGAEEAALFIGISRRKLDIEADKGLIKRHYCDSKPLYKVDDLKAYVDGLPTERSS
jgi:hypothetical protein